MDNVSILAGWLSCPTDGERWPIHRYIGRDPDTCSSHTNGNANTNAYSHTFINADSGTAWLSKAAGGLHTCGGQRSNA